MENPLINRGILFKGAEPVLSKTICTVRLCTSGENLLDLPFMTLSSQKLEPPLNPGRFTIFCSEIAKLTQIISRIWVF